MSSCVADVWATHGMYSLHKLYGNKTTKSSLGYSEVVLYPFRNCQCNISHSAVSNCTVFSLLLLLPFSLCRKETAIFIVKKWELLPSLFCDHLLLSTRLEMQICFVCKPEVILGSTMLLKF